MSDAFHFRGGDTAGADKVISLGGPYGDMTVGFVDAIDCRARVRIQALTPGEVCNAQHLLGVEYWMTLGRDQAKRAGKCLAYLVKHESLPLAFFRIPGKKAVYYRVL